MLKRWNFLETGFYEGIRFGIVYVADTVNHRIQTFSSIGDFRARWGSLGSGVGRFQNPQGIAVDGFGNVYVADTLNYRVQKFNANGEFLAHWGSLGSGDGEFNSPCGLTVDRAGNVYVADTGNHRVQVFSQVEIP